MGIHKTNTRFLGLYSYVEKEFSFGELKFNLKLLESACSTPQASLISRNVAFF